jgi:PiT family inorganic phosphate transporter
MPFEVYVVIGLALLFGFFNGYNDSANIIATIIFSRSMSPRAAKLITAAAEFAGPFLVGVAVARTIGSGVVSPEVVNLHMLTAALASAVAWGLFSSWAGIPSSSSHTLVGGLIGAVAAGPGFRELQPAGLTTIGLALFLSPIVGLLAGFLLTKLIFFLARNATLKVNWFFKRAQVLTGLGLALSHGGFDAQKTMGMITLGLVAAGQLDSFRIPFWVTALSAAALSLGTGVGSKEILKTLGGKFYRIKPVDGFAAQLASALVVLAAGLLGGPVSTTQVVSTAILGVGAAERVGKVRWNVVTQILLAWLLTIPITALVAAGLYALLDLLI